MGKLFEREYYPISTAAAELGCTVGDLIHFAATGRIRLGVLFAVDGFFLENYSYFGNNKLQGPVEEFTGFVYVDQGYFQEMELRDGDLRFGSVVRMDGRVIFKHPKAENFGQESRSINQIYIHSNDLRTLVSLGDSSATEVSLNTTGRKASLDANRANVSDKLAKMNQAAAKFWGNADRSDRGTHPDNATVTAWLVKQGFSQTLADKAATIIRPEWAPSGRRPEE